MASQSMGRICWQPKLCGAGRAIQIFLLETCDSPLIWLMASRTVSLPVIGRRRTLSPRPAPWVIT